MRPVTRRIAKELFVILRISVAMALGLRFVCRIGSCLRQAFLRGNSQGNRKGNEPKLQPKLQPKDLQPKVQPELQPEPKHSSSRSERGSAL